MKNTKILNSTLITIAAAASVLLMPGCGGSSSGGGTTTPTLDASFAAAQANPTENTVSFAEQSASGDRLTVDVNVTDTLDVYDAAFDVLFDDARVEFAGYTPGNLLEQEQNSPTYNISESSGRLIVSATRFGSSGTDAVGTRALIRLNFRVREEGMHDVAVTNTSLRDGGLGTIDASWYTGMIVGE